MKKKFPKKQNEHENLTNYKKVEQKFDPANFNINPNIDSTQTNFFSKVEKITNRKDSLFMLQNEESSNSIDNDYEFVKLVGKGTFGTVSLAKHKKTGKLVAIKNINLNQVEEDKVMKEYEIIKNLNNKRIVRIIKAYYQNQSEISLVMEYCPGGTLRETFEKHYNARQPIEEPVIRKWLFQILDGLEMLHSKNIVHRDIKPDNLMFDKNGELKIIDFGTSKYLSKMHMSNTLTGSPLFIAPEILNQNPEIDDKVDIWSVGILLYILCCFKYPYKENNPLSVQKQILLGTLGNNMLPLIPMYPPKIPFSAQLIEIYEKMTRINPSERYNSTQLLNLNYFKDFHRDYITENPRNKELAIQKEILSFSQVINKNYIKDIIPKLNIINEDIVKNGLLESKCNYQLKIALINFLTISNLPEEALKIINTLEMNQSFQDFLNKDTLDTWIFYSRKVENSVRIDKSIILDNITQKMELYVQGSSIYDDLRKMICLEALAYYEFSKGNKRKVAKDFIENALVCSQNEAIYRTHAIEISHLYNIAGIIFSKLLSPQNGLEFFEKSLYIKKNLNLPIDHESFFGTYLQLGMKYFTLHNYDASLTFFKMAIETLSKFDIKLQEEYQIRIEERIILCKLYLNFSKQFFDSNQEDFSENIKIISTKLHNKCLKEFIAFQINVGVFYAKSNQFTRAKISFQNMKKIILAQLNSEQFLYEIVISNLKVLNIRYQSKNINPFQSKLFMNIFSNFKEKDLEDDYKFIILLNFLSIIMINMNYAEISSNELFRNNLTWLENCLKINKQYLESILLNTRNIIQQRLFSERNFFIELFQCNFDLWNYSYREKYTYLIPKYYQLINKAASYQNINICMLNVEHELSTSNLLVCYLKNNIPKIEESKNLLSRISNQLASGDSNYYYFISYYNLMCNILYDTLINCNENSINVKFLQDNLNLLLNYDANHFLQNKIQKLFTQMNIVLNQSQINKNRISSS